MDVEVAEAREEAALAGLVRQFLQEGPRQRLHPIVRQARMVGRRVHAVRGRRAEQDGVAVGPGLRHRFGGEIAARAGAIVHDDLRLQVLGHLRLEQARHHVDAGAGREAHQDGDRVLGRPSLRGSEGRQQGQQDGKGA